MKIALVINDDFTMWHFRGGLITALLRRGHDVTTVTPPGPYVAKLEALGARHIAVPMDRFMNPGNDFLTMIRLYRVFRRGRYDIVHNMQIKPAVFGSIAARLARVPWVVSLVPGLGYPFFVSEPGVRLKALAWLILELLRLSGRLSDKVWFQNPDDMAFFIARGLVGRDRAVLIRGGGVDVEQYSPESVDPGRVLALRQELGLDGAGPVVVMVVARMIWCKGVREFIEAAERLRSTAPSVRFVLVGPFEHGHPDAIPPAYFQDKTAPNFIALTHFRTDIREILALAAAVVLPSYFREGVPRVLLEALALAKPIVTTDRPGCREVVDDGTNGYLVPARDSAALAGAIGRLVEDEGTREKFGRCSRWKAETEFAESIIVKRIITEVYGLP
ncbi:MAG: glycosyltransferase family 4 protein [Candidatus Rokubacteria bacterium]|nr:glycosyltransferase family 4 protein [Candidatus Rokubacteria bacterium]